ncbi:multidrug effflux MFS transporter [Acinetobacter qingfengensis]|uniref:Bcr/CflA family efflux transporter n=1 Tax=Acinetobacter qingfengensis TaxID=1262585 RepID=A0A1E7RD56_9GAMM|nr:multidrug effflux MFS transporter [Acinetobacter qingfengensis]KAA8734429.1 multidrug effflux MFS transporter [Acinetobacter qingfengensis]OEY97340.1 Bcr/CflA family drug resistance efflux transporter [Acinetobacter qingfengensis]
MTTSKVQSQSSSTQYSWQWITLLGLLTALGPLSIDMYLPALPEMAAQFNTTTSSISSSVPAYFLGLAIGQLIYGSLSDRIGRKKPLYIGLVIYILGSMICAMTANEWMLYLARVLQALGGCVGVVMARAAIRDCFDMNTSAQALAHMAMILGIAPIIAPMVGSVLISFFSWQSIFILLSLIGIIALFCVHFFFKETLPVERRLHLNLSQIIIMYGSIFTDSSFRTPMLAMSFFSGLMFCYITSASALFMESFGFSQKQFALVFGLNALGLMLFSFINSKVVRKVGPLPLLQLGGTIQLVGVILLSYVAFLKLENLHIVMFGLFLVVAAIGLTGPNATALALSKQQQRAGMASALIGSIQFAFGLLAGIILHLFDGSQLQDMASAMLVYALIGMSCVYVLRFRHRT